MRNLLAAFFLLWPSLGMSAGVIPVALAQQQDINGRPLAGALLYIYQVGTIATRQDSFQDSGLTIANQWPLPADATGRIPMFYLADGQVHVRLTDQFGVVQFDIPSIQVVGPSITGGGGGGTTVDPSAIASTGDIKFRLSGESLTGWVKLNGLTIGSALSGANTASDSLSSLYSYLWTNCNQAHCPVAGGMRGANAAADFMSNKAMTLPDWRGRGPVGLDDMGTTAAGRINATTNLITGGDGPTTPFAVGGASSHTMVIGDLIQHNHTLTDPGHTHTLTGRTAQLGNAAQTTGVYTPTAPSTPITTDRATTGITIASTGSATPNAFNTMSPFALGSWYMRL